MLKLPSMLMAPVKAAVVQAERRNYRRPRRLPRAVVPLAVERSYRIQLNNIITRMRNQIVTELLPLLAGIDNRMDAERMDQWPAQVSAAIERLKLNMTKSLITGSMVETLARAGVDVNDNNWIKISRAVLGVDLLGNEAYKPEAIEAFTEQNVGLITNLVDDTYAKVQQTVIADFSMGKRHEQIAKDLLSKGTDLPPGPFAKAKTRAEVIARDQVSKLNGQLTKARQTELGIEEYVWRAVMDGRTRPQDAEQNGKKFKWSDPPEGGHPGEKISCRCYAEPVVPGYAEVLGEEEAE